MSRPEVVDSLGVRTAVAATPEIVRANVEAVLASGLPNEAPIDNVVIAAGAATLVAARAVAAIAASRLAVPLMTVTDGQLPGWVDERTLVLGLDERVDAAASPAHAVGLATPSTRSAPIVETTAALAVLGAFGLLDGIAAELADAATHLEGTVGGWDAPDAPYRRLARRIGRTMPIIYGAGEIGAAAAAAWKAAANRLAKVPAFANAVPGLDHDEIVGWAQHGDVTRQVFTLVVLRHAFETDDEAHRIAVTAETCDEIVAGVHFVPTEAPSPVAALFDLMLQGEMVATDLAADANIDPGPVPILERFRI